jgi:hypothetical protein
MFVEAQEASTAQDSAGYCHSAAVAACSQPLRAEENTKLPSVVGNVQIGGGGKWDSKAVFSQVLEPNNFEV